MIFNRQALCFPFWVCSNSSDGWRDGWGSGEGNSVLEGVSEGRPWFVGERERERDRERERGEGREVVCVYILRAVVEWDVVKDEES